MSAERAYIGPQSKYPFHFEFEKLKELGFKRGMLLRVKMVNFLTYDDCEVFPGPKLNVILGPNGTGKSTITHAVCLACAGSPMTVGRSPDITQFVKKGKEGHESYVEIDLVSEGVNKTAKTVRIRRAINSESRTSKWSKDGKNSSEKEAKALASALNIDVDNLCNFMAQDKVGDFTTSDNKGMLSRTLQSIEAQDKDGIGLGKSLCDVQMELNDIEINKLNKGKEVTAKREAHDSVMVQLDSMAAEVDRIQRRDATKKLKEKYGIKLAVVRSTEIKNDVAILQKSVDEAMSALKKARDALTPLEEEERSLKRQLALHEKNQGSSKKTLQHTEEIIKANKAKMHEKTMALDAISDEISSIKAKRKEQEEQRDNHAHDIARLEAAISKVKAAQPEAKEKAKVLKAEQQELQQEKDTLDEARSDKEAEIRRLERQRQAIDRQMGNIQDPAQVYMTKLSSDPYFKDEVAMMRFIAENEGRLKKPVFGPVGLHLEVADVEASYLVNDALGKQNLNTFIVQHDDDLELLKGMNGRKNSVRIAKVSSVDLSLWNQVGSQYTPEAMHSFASFGFRKFLRDFIKCDDVLKTYLGGSCRGALETAYARTSNKASLTKEALHTLCPGTHPSLMQSALYLVDSSTASNRAGVPPETYKYNQSFSRYDRRQGASVSVKPVAFSSPNLLDKGPGHSDDGNQAELNEQLRSIEKQKKEKHAEMKLIGERAAKAGRDLSAKREKVQQLAKAFKEPQTLEAKLGIAKKKFTSVEHILAQGTRAKREQLENKYNSTVHSILDHLEVITMRSTDCVNLSVDVAIEEESTKALETALAAATQAYSEARQGLHAYEERKREAERSVEAKSEQLAEALNDLKAIQSTFEKQSDFVAYYRDEVNVPAFCPEATIAEIEERIFVLERQITSVADNAGIIERYDAAKREEEELRRSLEKLEADLEKHEETVEKQSKQWLSQVQTIIDKVDKNFSEYMEKLQFSGEVTFVRKGTFSEYELQLKVSFKNNQDVSVLDGKKHSGGERSVSTIMYLMALQHLISSPFRTVDEINQGMDERNERLVFDQIVKSSTGDKIDSQYFLVSPKLLQGLRSMEHEDVTVLMIWNGPGVRSKWQISDVIERIRKRKVLSDVTNDTAASQESPTPISKRSRGSAN